jgi:large subunit ribosomal protein L5
MASETNRMKKKYLDQAVPVLREKFKYTNVHQIPKFEKIVVNMGCGDAVQNQKLIEGAASDMMMITGQKPAIRRAKKSIANFKVRQGLPIGVAVTLRNDQMFEFMDRLVNIALPRVRDFRGIPRNAFDGRGNYSLGLNEQIIFPEIDIEKSVIRGLSITVVTSAKTNDEAYSLMETMGFPFRHQTTSAQV